MGYQEELQARLDAVRSEQKELRHVVNVDALKASLLDEVSAKLTSSYDLDESDLLRYFKIERLATKQYPKLFNRPGVLRLLFIIAYVEGITPQELHQFNEFQPADFKETVRSMIQSGLIKVESSELYISDEGAGFLSRIGMERY